MNKEGKIFWLILLVAATAAAAGGFFAAQYSVDTALAQSQSNPLFELQKSGVGYTEGTEAPPRDIRLIIFQIVQILLGVVGTALIILILYAAYMWWSARGNEEAVKKAKATLRNALIGMIIIMMSYGLVTFIFRWVLVEGDVPSTEQIQEQGSED